MSDTVTIHEFRARCEIDRLRAINAELLAALEIVAKAELYDLSTGIIDADVLEAVQENARAAIAKAQS